VRRGRAPSSFRRRVSRGGADPRLDARGFSRPRRLIAPPHPHLPDRPHLAASPVDHPRRRACRSDPSHPRRARAPTSRLALVDGSTSTARWSESVLLRRASPSRFGAYAACARPRLHSDGQFHPLSRLAGPRPDRKRAARERLSRAHARLLGLRCRPSSLPPIPPFCCNALRGASWCLCLAPHPLSLSPMLVPDAYPERVRVGEKPTFFFLELKAFFLRGNVDFPPFFFWN